MDALPPVGEASESLDGDGHDRRPVSIRGTLGARQPSGPRPVPSSARRWTLWSASAAMACVGALVVYQVLLSGLASGNEGLPDGGAPVTSTPASTATPAVGGVPADPTSTGSTPTAVPTGTGSPVTPPAVIPSAANRPTGTPHDTRDDRDGGDDGGDGDNSEHGSGNSGSGSGSGSDEDNSGSGEDNSGPGSDD